MTHTARHAFPLLLALACTTPDPSQPSTPVLDSEVLTTEDLAREDVRGTATAVARDRAMLDALSPEDHAEAVTVLRRLAASDPFTRAALQLPFALHAVVRDIPPTRLDRIVQADWRNLQHGLATHVALLTSLGVDLAPPTAGEPLFGDTRLVDRATLLASEDPLIPTQAWLDAVVPVAQSQTPATRAAIDADSDRIEALTGLVRPCPRDRFHVVRGQPWTLGTRLAGWHDALRKIEPFVADPQVAQRIGAMLALFAALDAANTTYVGDSGTAG